MFASLFIVRALAQIKTGSTKMLKEFRLQDADRSAIRSLLTDICGDPRNREENSLLERIALYAQELPLRIREVFYEFKLRETSAALIITNNPVSPDDIGPTPQRHWRPGEIRPLSFPQVMHGLYASLLGELFGFQSQQYGRIFNDLIPIRGQLSYSSSGGGSIGLHSEDCFHSYAPDYLGLLCLRNDERAGTTLSCLVPNEIPENYCKVLFEETFAVKVPRHGVVKPVSGPILFGDRQQPYLQFTAIDDNQCTVEMRAAFDFVKKALAKNMRIIALSQGDCLYVDNLLAVHGRAAYEPLFENGRWFCRLIVSRDLRKTRTLRSAPDGRIMLDPNQRNAMS